ncbi:AAA family ATPase [Terriglobus albidus]|uniref:AAA family ATPase n=1 Tax=Terriglobus albidus TaxID=1592106 RepID=A0A5B9E4X1_9BACT|nr:orc1/cdc6 family replication initiation protein [Terriglobus albidus]QEE27343.1 AAA family ATPase [Terriglobus albidus]
MVQTPELAKAVASIPQRSEKQSDSQKLMGAFVDLGILPQINNINSQIIYGRRGTGKTHVLKVLQSQLTAAPRCCVIYIDARTFGSTSQFSDVSIGLSARCTALFRDFLAELYNGFLEFVVAEGGKNVDLALDEINNLAESATQPIQLTKQDSATANDSKKGTSETGGIIKSEPSKLFSLEGKAGRTTSTEQSTSSTYRFEYIDKVIFPAISTPIKNLTLLCNATFYILLDEWSSIPIDIQPYFAEFLKRSVIPLTNVAVKIGSLEYRSDFAINTERGFIGLEMGADISAFLDIDDYYVYDRNPERITDAFADMLVRHLRNELPENYLEGIGIETGAKLASKLFTERKVFQELVRASEGVIRDLINIFSKAYFFAHRKGKDKIERDAVLEAARQWFEQDKERNLSERLRIVLRTITDNVIGNKRARSFLLPRELANHPVIHELFDLRVLHLVQRGYADKDKPGVRYNIYSLDYGTYVDLMNTSRRPELGFIEYPAEADNKDYVVPFDDKRSIRRIILGKEILDDAGIVD